MLLLILTLTQRRCSAPRPVSVPVGALANLTLRMISVSSPAEDGDVCGAFLGVMP